MRRPKSPSTGSKSGRTQNNPSMSRKGHSGAPAGNENARKSLAWLDSYDLSAPQGLDSFMQEVVRRVWTGELGTRAASSINGTLRLLLEHLTLPALEKRITELEKVKPN